MSFLSVGSIQRARRLHDLRQSISHGPPMPRCGSAGSRGLFPATFSPHTARARCVLNSTARPRRIGKPFSHLRAKELRPGGRLVVVLPALADDGSSGFTPLFDEANAALEEMVTDGVITSEERSRMVLGPCRRRRSDSTRSLRRQWKIPAADPWKIARCSNFPTPLGSNISATGTRRLW